MSVDPVDASCSSLPDSLFSLSNLPVAPQPQSKSKHNDRYFVKTEAGRKKRQTPVVDLSADTDQDSDIDEVSDSEPERAAAGTHQQQRTELSPSSNRAPSPPLRAPNPHPEAKPKPSMSLIDGQNLTQLDASVLDQQSRQLLGLKDSNDAKGVLVCLKSAESFHVCGQSKLSVLKGEIECHGARLLSSDAQPIDIFAPITHVLPCFTTSRRPQSSSKSSRFLSCLTSAPEALEHTSILDLLHTFDAVLLLTPHSCSGIEAVEDQLKLGHMFSRSSNLWKGRQAAYNASSFQLYTETPSMQDLAMATTLPEDWDDIIQRVEADFGMMQQGIVTAVGPKRSGKSTLGKAMVNRLLQSSVFSHFPNTGITLS